MFSGANTTNSRLSFKATEISFLIKRRTVSGRGPGTVFPYLLEIVDGVVSSWEDAVESLSYRIHNTGGAVKRDDGCRGEFDRR